MNEHEHDDLLKRLDSLNADVPPLPEGFHEGWVSRLEDDMETSKKRFPKQTLTRVLSAAAALVFIIGGTLMARQGGESAQESKTLAAPVLGQGQARSSMALDTMDTGANTFMADVEYEDEAVEYGFSMGSAKTTAAMPEERMLIRTASLTIGTQQYDESMAVLRSLCASTGGWIASTSESASGNGLRTCYMTLRIPADQLDGFLTGTEELGRVTRRSETAEDVTESYYDTRSRLETQQALMARLQAMVTDAASLADLLALESQIADTQYQIDRLQSSLNTTERRVNYATVDITLREEDPSANITDSEKTLIERLMSAVRAGGAAFLRLLENVVIFLAAALPFIAIVAVVWLTVALLRKRLKKSGKP